MLNLKKAKPVEGVSMPPTTPPPAVYGQPEFKVFQFLWSSRNMTAGTVNFVDFPSNFAGNPVPTWTPNTDVIIYKTSVIALYDQAAPVNLVRLDTSLRITMTGTNTAQKSKPVGLDMGPNTGIWNTLDWGWWIWQKADNDCVEFERSEILLKANTLVELTGTAYGTIPTGSDINFYVTIYYKTV